MSSGITTEAGISYAHGVSGTAGISVNKGITDLPASSLPVAAASFDLTSGTLPTGWTHIRSDSPSGCATGRDASGILQHYTTGTAIFRHDITGTALGLQVENGRVNTCTNKNASPTDLTGITAGGDVAAVLSCIDDTTNLTVAKLHQVGNAKVIEIDNTLGITAATATISGTIGSTSASSMQAYVYCVSGSGSIGTSDNATTQAFSANSTYTLTQLLNVTPSATTIQMRVTAAAGAKVRFILNQFEVGGNPTSIIITNGATASRGTVEFGDLSWNTRSYCNLAQGAVVVDLRFDDINYNSAVSRAFTLTDTTNGFTATAMSTYRIVPGTRRHWAPQFIMAGASEYLGDLNSYDAVNQHFPVAMSWQDGVQGTYVTGGGYYQTFTIPSGIAASAITRIFIGGRVNTAETVCGTVRSVKFYTSYLTAKQLISVMIDSGCRGLFYAGQSNASDLSWAQVGANNSGEIAMKAITDPLWTASRNFYVNSATPGTSRRYEAGVSGASDWWYDTATGNIGVPFARWRNIAQGFVAGSGSPRAIIDVAGESDAGNCTIQQYVDASIAVYNIMRGDLGPVPVIMVPIGANGSTTAYQTIREAQWQLAGPQNPGYIYITPERFDLKLADGLHIIDGGADTAGNRGTTQFGQRIARKMHKVLGDTITGGVDGPTITAVSRVGTAVTVTITHDGGTDFMPTTSISGFHYYNGSDDTAPQNTITAAVRTNATTITLTLTTSSAGTLYYGHASLSVDTQANLVMDNNVVPLPLRSNKITVA